MADPGCVFLRTLLRANKASSSPAAVCRELVFVVELQRYGRDQGSSVYFPQAVLSGNDLYDVTLTDGDCRLRVTLDPGLNRLVERHSLRAGAALHDAAFTPSMAAQLPACPGASRDTGSYRLVSVEVKGQGGEEGVRPQWASLPWFGPSAPPGGPLLPLRANRVVFLPLWNNVDFTGVAWRETPPPEEDEDEDEDEEEASRPAATILGLRDAFLSGHRGVARGVVRYQLIVRIINKSHLMYYGKVERNCECPYKAVLEVCDCTGSVSVVLWNSVCVSWYRRMKPGDIISLSHYRVKQRYQAECDDIEISVNSRNPATRISVLPECRVSADSLPPAPPYSFHSSKELLDRPHGSLCDVIGLLTFTGRAERVRVKEGRGAELLEYRWLQLEDGHSDQPIMVKLFSTSQPQAQRRLLPLSVVVCCRLKVIKAADQTSPCFYLTNTTYTQVYCTGMGHHSEMSYRKLPAVRHFLQWLRGQDDEQVLSRALIGGFFIFPPPPVCLETFMKDRRGEPGFLRGAELHRELERLCYRERRTFCIQAVVTMVTHCRRGEEHRCLFWMDRASSLSPSSSSPRSSLSSPSTPRSSRPPPSSPSSFSSSSFSPSSALSHVTPCPPLLRTRKLWKRKALLQPDTPNKRRPQVTLQPEVTNKKVILFESSMEFLENTDPDEGDDDDDDDDASSYATCPLPPAFTPVPPETLTMRYDHDRREEQAAAVAMGGRATASGRFETEEYFTLRLRALSDGVSVDTIFLPRSSSSSSLSHCNTWTSILSHGAFNTHTPPPSPADLIAMAAQLTNRRLVCVLEACHLGGDTSEIILSRAFQLMD